MFLKTGGTRRTPPRFLPFPSIETLPPPVCWWAGGVGGVGGLGGWAGLAGWLAGWLAGLAGWLAGLAGWLAGKRYVIGFDYKL